MNSSETVFRSRSLAAFAWLCAGIIAIMYTVLVFQHVRDIFSGAIILAAGIYLMWLLGSSAVRVGNEAVVIDNLLIRHYIPWPEIEDINVDYGIKFVLRDGREIGSIMYGGSVIGQLTGYRYARRAIARMSAIRGSLPVAAAGAKPLPASYSRRLHFNPWPPLIILALLEGIGALSLLTK